MKRHNVILESNVEPKDNNVLWLQGNKLKKFGNTGWENIIEGDVVTTDRIENGAVTTDKIATNAFDSTLSKSEKIAPANIVGNKITTLNEKVDALALGKFYGYFPDSSSFPTDVSIPGYAYVRLNNSYEIWNFSGESWSDSGVSIDENDVIITTDRIKDGAVTSEKISTNAFDDTLSVSGKIASADVVGEKLTELDQRLTDVEKVSELGISIGEEEVDADFEITDDVGNAIVRFQNGHIKTKFFDSSKITTEGGGGGGDGICYPDLSTKTWCSLGTSITWYNNNQGGKFDKGYQGWLMAKMPIGTLINKGVNGGTIINLAASVSSLVQIADIYTIEHGVNDWGHNTVVGTISDYINNTGNNTFFGAFRIIIDAIYAKNGKAVIILCTPRKARGFNGYLPSSCNGERNGIKLKDYADAVMEVARYEGLPVCDWFNRCGVNDHNLPLYSIDDALHPNDLGYKQMAQLLIEQFKNIY